ncbi:MAG: arginine--tRNA ligase [Deltaproteobacteria bacterium]|nr:arginine--tRNA ligase [Deltaproteobacteria bacterium]
MKKRIEKILQDTLQLSIREGYLKEMPEPHFAIQIPADPRHGNFATNLAMIIAGAQKNSPKKIAEVLIEHLQDRDNLISKTEIGGPGFINFFIEKEKWYEFLGTVIALGDKYGESNLGKNEKIMIEFVSANPTGPIHLGHGRGAALGDSLCRVLNFCGYDARREFYINDGGRQVKILGESVYSRWKQLDDPTYPFPDNGYQGDYVKDLAIEVSNKTNLEDLDYDTATTLLSDICKEKILKGIKEDLINFRINFDFWYKESELYSSGKIDTTITVLEQRGLLYEKEGALWLKTSLFGDDKDRVIRKNDGELTYFATDISYHFDKWERGFKRVINVWGADHHGYVDRMKAATKAEGIPENWLDVLLIQLVRLWEGGQEVKMSKRAGRYVTLSELVNDVGVDAVRFIFLSKDNNSPIDFDIDLAKKKDSENPVYYVQYAHARICSVFRKAAEQGLKLPEDPGQSFSFLDMEEELSLIRKIAEFPSLVEEIAVDLAPHRLTYYLAELAGNFHRYYNKHRIVIEDIHLSMARLSLSMAVKIVIKNGLRLLGVNAPEEM